VSASASTSPAAAADIDTPQPTLYEILGASRKETRMELKKRYIALARQSHPDALRQNGSPEANADFNEIATAWSILSDDLQRKRYDRSLRAEKISRDISSWAGNVTEQARPAADFSVELLEKIAFPFLRRTTATTLAGFQAAAQDIATQRKNKDNNFSIREAVAAAQRAGRVVDKMEFTEKAEELEARAVQEYKQGMDLQTKLQEMTAGRLRLPLHTSKSGLTASEALLLLEDMNKTTVPATLWDRARIFRLTVKEEVSELKTAEDAFVQGQVADSQSQEAYRTSVGERLVTKTALENAKQAENTARLAYEQAQQNVFERQAAYDTIDRTFFNVEAQAQKTSYELERRSVVVEQQSEKVRQALKQKQMAIGRAVIQDSTSPVDNDLLLEQLEEMRQEERVLAETSTQFEVKAARLLSRANKLKIRAKNLEQ
jgi:curved DNA-binding protein CbpA